MSSPGLESPGRMGKGPPNLPRQVKDLMGSVITPGTLITFRAHRIRVKGIAPHLPCYLIARTAIPIASTPSTRITFRAYFLRPALEPLQERFARG
ncbi:hypothetical protein PGTUg99_016331 [Puccinia graminis f. sp. tritici]|uniref:Uncharacterized protein n=1 Tax=Puccinia graminis f. sp. tritici TaxID=56615 RepID=A0A5B0Q4F5_PUCGR|nr:hypothetical protein PGTUg99_016331 [Puccinia graminis f. sp. tritici]